MDSTPRTEFRKLNGVCTKRDVNKECFRTSKMQPVKTLCCPSGLTGTEVAWQAIAPYHRAPALYCRASSLCNKRSRRLRPRVKWVHSADAEAVLCNNRPVTPERTDTP
eukprot:3375566-Pleurochrysis_carterae.AAC.1